MNSLAYIRRFIYKSSLFFYFIFLFISTNAHSWESSFETDYFAIKNRATGKVLDHYEGNSIQAYNNDETHPHHQWKMIPYNNGATYALKNRATGKVLDHYYGWASGKSIRAEDDDQTHPHHQWEKICKNPPVCTYYALKNSGTGKVLDHYEGNSIQAYNNDETHPHHQWELVKIYDPVYYIFSNLGTSKVLDHYYGRTSDEGIQASSDDVTHPNHQWEMIPNANSSAFAIRNRATGKVLDHYYANSIRATDEDLTHPHHQWEIIDHNNGASFAIKNTGTGKVLDHYYGWASGKSIRAEDDDQTHPHHQWLIKRVNFRDIQLVELTDYDKQEITPSAGGGSWPFPGVAAVPTTIIDPTTGIRIRSDHIRDRHMPGGSNQNAWEIFPGSLVLNNLLGFLAQQAIQVRNSNMAGIQPTPSGNLNNWAYIAYMGSIRLKFVLDCSYTVVTAYPY